MSFLNKIPRGLRVLVVMLVCAILIWQFAVDTDYLYHSIGLAVLITFGVIVLVYQPFKSAKTSSAKSSRAAKTEMAEDPGPGSDSADLEFENFASDDFANPAARRAPAANAAFKETAAKPNLAGTTRTQRPAVQSNTLNNRPGAPVNARPSNPSAAANSRPNNPAAGFSPRPAAKSAPLNARPPLAKDDEELALSEDAPPADRSAAARPERQGAARSSFFSQIPRGLQVLVVMAACAVLIWLFTAGTQYFYYSLGAAVLITFGVIVLVYKPFKSSRSSSSERPAKSRPAESPENPEFNPEELDSPPAGRIPAYPSSKLPQPNRSGADRSPRPAVQSNTLNNRPGAPVNARPSNPSAAANSRPNNPAAGFSPRPAAKSVPLNARPPLASDDEEIALSEETPLEGRSAAARPERPADGKSSFFSHIPRGLQVLVVMAACAVLIWLFAAGTQYFYYSLGAAVLITFGVIVLVYKPFKSAAKSGVQKNQKVSGSKSEESFKGSENADSDTFEVESDYTDTPSILRAKSSQPFRTATTQPKAGDPTRRYTKIAPSGSDDARLTKPITGKNPAPAAVPANPEAAEAVAANPDGAPAIPLVEDETVLTEEDKNLLLNAVWYRCENPYCKYTNFLGVHHIVEEKDGGTNRLDNLIVLCPYCHDLAHRGEIPEEEMREWIGNRETRFKFKPDWKYF
jgi:hypothetical protein